MKTIKLYGNLAKLFGKTHTYNVRTPAEAIRALMANFPDFQKEILDKKYLGYKVICDEDIIDDKDKLAYPVSKELKIIPVVQGAGGNGTLNIIIGVVLIVAAVALSPYTGGGSLSAALAAGEYGTAAAIAGVNAMAIVGTSLVLSGISSLLFTPSTPTSRDAEEQITSQYFNGPVNLTTQGNPIPVVYGRLRVGSQVVSAGILTYKE